MKKVLGLALLAMLAMAPTAFADSITVGGITWSITATNTTMSITISNANAATYYIQYFSPDIYTGTITATDAGNTGGQTYSIHDGNGNNSQPIGACKDSGPASAFCVLLTSSGALTGDPDGAGPLTGGSITFNFNISGGTLQPVADWHLQSYVSLFEGGCTNENQESCKIAISQGGFTPPPPQVPEPASMVLLGTGLLGSGRLIRKRLKK